jgi:hypothetical protein
MAPFVKALVTPTQQSAEIAVHEGDEPDPLAHLFHADVLSGKH